MKKLSKFIACILILFCLLYIGCKKNSPCTNCNQQPIANAGQDMVITLPVDSVMLDGSTSSDIKGVIGYEWRKISGPDTFSIVTHSLVKTVINHLKKGIYEFELTVLNKAGLSAKDTLNVTLNHRMINRQPVANAGKDITIRLPVNATALDGAGSTDPDNNIANYTWTKISGPASFNSSDPHGVKTILQNLELGVYQFELKVSDAGGLTSADTVAVTAIAGLQHWMQVQHLPENEFFFGPRLWFDGANFLMGIDDNVFAVSNHGNVWKYDISANGWVTVTNFPEQMTRVPVVFAAGGKAYCTADGHCWEFNPVSYQWTRKTDPPGDLFHPLVINNTAYLSSSNGQLLAYDPATDAYKQKNNRPAGTDELLGYFVVDGRGYYTSSTGECWQYDPGKDRWQQKAVLSLAGTMYHTSSFSLNHYGYILGDVNLAAYNNNDSMQVWRYDPSSDKWKPFEEDYPGHGAYLISTISQSEKVFVGLGYNNGDFNAIDCWIFK